MAQNPQHIKYSSFKLIESDPHSINRNPLNKSSAKMQYSIPKAKRSELRQNIYGQPRFYDLPDIHNDRSTSFGYGNKSQLVDQHFVTPSPSAYYIKSQFQADKKKGITMGAGRQIVRSNSVFGDTSKNIVPGPTKYQPVNAYPSYSFSLRSRIEDKSEKWKKSVPGPGNYQTLQLINKQLKVPVSKFKDPPSTKIGKQKRKSQVQELSRINNIPGVGKYNTVQSDSVNKFKKYGGSKFSSSPRKGIVDSSLNTPGPGSQQQIYQLSKVFSDFIY